MSKARKTIGERLPAPGRIRLGDILAVPLGNNLWGYIRDLKDAGCAILDARSEGAIHELSTIVGSATLAYREYCEPWDRPAWIYVGKWRFEDEDDAWPPPWFSRDIIDPTILKIYHRGRFIERTRDERKVNGIREGGSLDFPGHLVEVIRGCLGLESDRAKIEKFAPFTAVWEPAEALEPNRSEVGAGQPATRSESK